FWILFSTITIALMSIVIYYYRPKFGELFSLADISALYDIRAEYKLVNSNIPGLVQYVFTWCVKAVTPIILAIGLVKGNKSISILGLVLTFVLFAVSGHKSIFFGPFAIIGIWFL